MSTKPVALTADQVHKPYDLSFLNIETTEEIEPCQECVGQERALSAISLALGVNQTGYNLYLCGPRGVGKTSTIKAILEQISKTKPTPPDWCYVHNFLDPNSPKAISLATGQGKVFKRDMEQLVETLQREIPKAFEGKEYEEEKQKLINQAQKEKAELFESLQQRAAEKQIQLQFSPTGVITVPLYQGKPLTQEEYMRLSDEEKEDIKKRKEELDEDVNEVFKKARQIDRETADKLKELEKKVALFAVSDLLDGLREKYNPYPDVIDYLHHVQRHILEHIDMFRGEKTQAPQALPFAPPPQTPSFTEFKVNVVVDNSRTEGAPVVFETHPIYSNLFGTIEREVRFGVLTTDFTMIRAGSLAKANGGYLVVEALDVLKAPFVWDSLKKALENSEVSIEDVFQQYGYPGSIGLRPEPIKLDVKVILIGNPFIYNMLYAFDEDFGKLFKVKADFDSVVARNEEQITKYVSFVKFMCDRNNIRPLHRSALEALLEHASRLAGDQEKISVRHGVLSKIVVEADYLASLDGNSECITRGHIERAVEDKIYRSNMIEEKIQEMIKENTIIVDTDGQKVGQINGVAVLDLGDYAFGKPTRITCDTFMGTEGVVSIERRAKLSGNIHDKGVLILSGYLGEQYATDKPLSLSATIAFEQSYSMVEGDSASAAELIALLSSLSGVPIRQDLAITGSVDQKGNIQPIGGVNEKIEGFYRTCKVKGLTGTQGIVIPKRNVRNLMLNKELIEAVREGKFHIYPVAHIDEAIEIMTGRESGKRREDGSFPEGTVHYLANKKLTEFMESLRQLSRNGGGPRRGGGEEGEEEEK